MPFDQRGLPAPETLHELFDRHHIELHEVPVWGRQHGGARSKIYCPECGGGKEKERNFFVKIDPDGQGACWHCFRANRCGFSGGGRLRHAPQRTQAPPKHYRKPQPAPQVTSDIPASLVGYFEKFGISERTLAAFSIYRIDRRMPVLTKEGKEEPGRRAERPVIAYPYFDDGELTNVKYKTVYQPSGKKRFVQEPDCRPTLYNIDAFENDEWGIFVEGEDDVLAIYETGWKQVTSLPDGSPTKLAETFDRATDDDQRYAPLYGEPRIDRLKKIYLAGDMDDAGRRHHEEIARRVGKQRCWEVRWPNGCKDAKETLQKSGVEAVHQAIEDALPYPLEGVFQVLNEDVANHHAGVVERSYVTGLKALDERLALRDSGSFVVTTGVPGYGKTTFWTTASLMYTERVEEEMKYDRLLSPFHTVFCSAEMQVMDVVGHLIAQRTQQPFRSSAVAPQAPLDLVLETAAWVRKRYTFLHWPDISTIPTISWLMQRLRENILRTGAKLAVIDPWQEFDDEMPHTEHNHSRYLGKLIQKLVGMSKELRCNIVVVTHPTKLRNDKDGYPIMPTGYDIADTGHFFSRCDIGITIHRGRIGTDEMIVHIWKAKNPQFSHYGESTFRLDPHTYRLWPKPTAVESSYAH